MVVVFIHGPPASGKLTIARALARLLAVPLFHNHLAVDLAAALFEFGTPQFAHLRETVWLAAFEAAAAAGRSFIFTFAPEATVAPGLIDRLAQLISTHGGQVRFISVVCSEATLEARLESPSRAAYGKLQDVALFRQIRASGGFEFPPLPAPLLVIDSEITDPETAARRIFDALAVDASTPQN